MLWFHAFSQDYFSIEKMNDFFWSQYEVFNINGDREIFPVYHLLSTPNSTKNNFVKKETQNSYIKIVCPDSFKKYNEVMYIQ